MSSSLIKKSGIALLLLLGMGNCAKAQWVPTNGPLYGFIRSFATMDDTIFASAGFQGNLYKSTDQGSHWTQIVIPDVGVNNLMVRGNVLFVAGFDSLYRSTDGGSNWKKINPGKNAFPNALLSQNSKYIYTAVAGIEVFHSSDNGDTWTGLDSLLPNNDCAFSLFANDSVILVGSCRKGMYRTTNEGHTWSSVSGKIHNSVFLINMIRSGTNTFFAASDSLYRSTDYGNSWSVSDTNIALDMIRYGNYLFAVGYSGIFRTADEGLHWQRMDSGLNDLNIRAITSHAGNLIVGTFTDWIYESQDTGKSWTRLSGGIRFGPRNLIAYRDTIFAGTDRGVYRTTDGGSSWIPKNFGRGDLYNVGFAMKDSAIFSCDNGGNGENFLYRSVDNGNNWKEFSFGGNSVGEGFGISLFDSSIFILNGNSGISRFTSNPDTIISCYVDTIVFPSSGYAVNSICSIGSQLFAGGYRFDVDTQYTEILRSLDAGIHWHRLNTLHLQNSHILFLIIIADTILAGTNNRGIFRSTDLGESWTVSNMGLSKLNLDALTLGVKNIYAGTDSGIFVSSDNARSWKEISQNLPNKYIYCLLESNGYLYAGIGVINAFDYVGIANEGVWKRPLSDFSSVPITQIVHSKFNILSNPTTSSADFQFDALQEPSVFELFDALGRSLLRRELPAGQTGLHMDMQNYPAGIYFARLGGESVKVIKN